MAACHLRLGCFACGRVLLPSFLAECSDKKDINNVYDVTPFKQLFFLLRTVFDFSFFVSLHDIC